MTTNEIPARTRSEHNRKGFTLTEIAIVLGIMGLILGAIWVAASGVYANQRASKAETMIVTASQNIRAMYAASSQTGVANGTDLTNPLCSAGVFPVDMTLVCPMVASPWVTGSAGVTVFSASTNTGTQDAFELRFINVPRAACIKIITNLGRSAYWVGRVNYAPAASNMPMTAGNALTNVCTADPGPLNIVFTLK